MANRNELFDERDKLAEEIRDLSDEFDEAKKVLEKKYLSKINELSIKIGFIRGKLYELGVPIEDC
jgi:hypothetical protein